MIDGQKVIEAAEFDITVRRQRLDVKLPADIAQEIDTIVDSGSGIEAISGAVGQRCRKHLRHARTGTGTIAQLCQMTSYDFLEQASGRNFLVCHLDTTVVLVTVI